MAATGGMSTRERGVGGDGHGVLLLSLGQHLEEQLDSTAVEFHVAEFVDAEKPTDLASETWIRANDGSAGARSPRS
jgi:hypothetical protein